MKNKTYFALILTSLLAGNVFANVQELGDSQELGLNDAPKNTASKSQGNPEDKISNLGRGAYIRQYNDFGQPMVEVHPENGPSYFYNEREIQAPKADDGVYDRQTPQWMIGTW